MNRRGDRVRSYELITRLPAQFLALVKAEYENAKREIADKAKRAGIGLLAIVVALFFLLFAIGCLVAAAVAGFVEGLQMPVWLAAIIVAVILLILAAIAILGGVWFIKRGVPVPEDTIERVEGDLQAMAEVRVNASAHTSPQETYLPNDDAHVSTATPPQPSGEGNWR